MPSTYIVSFTRPLYAKLLTASRVLQVIEEEYKTQVSLERIEIVDGRYLQILLTMHGPCYMRRGGKRNTGRQYQQGELWSRPTYLFFLESYSHSDYLIYVKAAHPPTGPEDYPNPHGKYETKKKNPNFKEKGP